MQIIFLTLVSIIKSLLHICSRLKTDTKLLCSVHAFSYIHYCLLLTLAFIKRIII